MFSGGRERVYWERMGETYFYVKRLDTFFIGVVGELNTQIKFSKAFQKSVNFFFTMRPYKENIINISTPNEGLQLLRFKKTCLKFVHENTHI